MVDPLTDPAPDDPLDSPSHAGQHGALNAAAADLAADLAAHAALPHGGGSGGAPSGPAGGVLGGTYPDPAFAADMATQVELDAHAAAADPHAGYRLESADHTHASTGIQAGQVAHAALSGVTSGQHHAQAHALSGADHTGTLTDAQIPATIARDAEVAGAYVALAPAGEQVIAQNGSTIALVLEQDAGSTGDILAVRGSDGVDRVRVLVNVGFAAQFIFQDSSAPQIRAHAFGASPVPNIVMARSRSTVIGTPGTIVNNGDAIGTITWQADDGATIATQAANIRADVDGVPAAGDIPGRLVFLTRAKAGAIAERMRIDQAGRVGIGVVPASNAGRLSVLDGITWPATNVPLADTHTLDDYEEGTFTAGLTAQTPGDLAVTYGIQYGRYVKIGRLVQWWIRIQAATWTWTTAASNVRVTGLPFTPMTLAGMSWSGAANIRYTRAGFAGATSYVASADPNIYFMLGSSGAQPALVTIADMPSGAAVPQIYASGAYETDL